jgi:hypothetical protein
MSVLKMLGIILKNYKEDEIQVLVVFAHLYKVKPILLSFLLQCHNDAIFVTPIAKLQSEKYKHDIL